MSLHFYVSSSVFNDFCYGEVFLFFLIKYIIGVFFEFLSLKSIIRQFCVKDIVNLPSKCFGENSVIVFHGTRALECAEPVLTLEFFLRDCPG